MKVIFRKIYNNHKRIRDERIEGECSPNWWPQVGRQFVMTAPPRDAGDLRWIQTSRITELLVVSRSEFCLFKTESGSYYSVEVAQ